MASARHLGIADAAFTAAVDLTAKQYYWVKPGSVVGEVNLATGGSDTTPIGVLQNSPSAGQEARVRIFGFTKVYAVAVSGSPITYGNFIGVNLTAESIRTITVGGASAVLGRWLDATVPSTGSRYGEALIFGGANFNALSAS